GEGVLVDVGDHHLLQGRPLEHCRGHERVEAAARRVEEHGDVVRAGRGRACGDDVRVPVAVQVGHGDAAGVDAHGEGAAAAAGEVARAVAQQEHDAAGRLAIGDHQIQVAVLVEVGGGHGRRLGAGGVLELGTVPEGPVAVAQADRDAAPATESTATHPGV